MATIRLIPSTYYLSSTTYLSVSNDNNMYHNTDNTTYATVTNSQTGTTTYYIYLRGFNFDDIPNGAIIDSFSIKLKARESGININSSYSPKLCNDTSQLTSTCSAISTTATTYTFSGYSEDLDDLRGYGDDFGIRINCRRANRNTTGYMYIYGAEIEVNYTMPNPRTVTSTLTGDGTISPSGATSTYEGAEYELTITPTVKTDAVTATQDGVDITDQLVPHGNGSTVSLTAASVSTSGVQSGSSYAQYAVGRSVDNPYSSTNNMYASNGSTGYAAYTFDFSSIPSDATIEEITVQCYGHRENATIDSTHVSNVALYYGNTQRGEDVEFQSTSDRLVTISDTGTWTREELDNLTLRHTVGYYGGLVLGITLEVRYSIGDDIDHYTYTYTVSSNSTINVTITSRTKYTVTATSEVAGITVSPATQDAYEGDSATVILNDNTNIVVTDNDVDVTSQLQFRYEAGETQTFTGIPTSFDESSTYGSIYEGTTSSGLSSHTDTTRICCYVTQTAYAEARLIYNFDCSSIPQNATITSVSCIASAACYSSGQYFDVKTLQLYSGNTAKGTAATITGNGNTRTEHNISGGSWTRSELNNAKIVLHIQRGNNTTEASFSFWGATLSVTYSIPQSSYYEYTVTNVQTNHTIIVSQGVIVPIDEDPEKTYYPVTVSSINASTDPINGTTRIEGGTSSTITIYPTDPQLTLITDNGVDVSSQLVSHGGTIPDPVVSTAPGASYGFNLNSSTGYYVSTNGGISKSASVARVTFNLPVRCLITIQYINYAEANYDYGMFGKIDTSVATDGLTASSTSSSPSDSTNNYQLAMASNNANAQTITYTIESGEHFIDIKYGKDDASDDNNDSLQWKITSIEPLESNVAYYTYALSNVDQDHSLIFIFGDVTYYFVNSSTTTNCKLYPNGSTVKLPGDTYSMTIVPNDVNDQITLRDNNVDVTSSLERTETNIEKNGNTIRVVNYQYTLSNVQATHNLIVYSINGGRSTYIKTNGSWNETTFIRKESNKWSNITYTKVWVHNGTSWVESPNRTIVASGIIFKET